MHEPHISKWADKLDYYPEEADAGGGSKKNKQPTPEGPVLINP